MNRKTNSSGLPARTEPVSHQYSTLGTQSAHIPFTAKRYRIKKKKPNPKCKTHIKPLSLIVIPWAEKRNISSYIRNV